MSVLQLKPWVTAPLLISACVVWPWSPDSVLSPERQWAIGMEALASAGVSAKSARRPQRGVGIFLSSVLPGNRRGRERGRSGKKRSSRNASDGFPRGPGGRGLGAMAWWAAPRCASLRPPMRMRSPIGFIALLLIGCGGSADNLTDLAGNKGSHEVIAKAFGDPLPDLG